MKLRKLKERYIRYVINVRTTMSGEYLIQMIKINFVDLEKL